MSFDSKIVEDLITLKKEVREIRDCLLGNRIEGKPGILEYIEEIRREIYGDPSRHQIGLVEKHCEFRKMLEILEKEKEAIRWMAIGWASAVSVILSILGYWIRFLFSK